MGTRVFLVSIKGATYSSSGDMSGWGNSRVYILMRQSRNMFQELNEEFSSTVLDLIIILLHVQCITLYEFCK